MKRRSAVPSALVLCGGIPISGGVVEKSEQKKEVPTGYCNPVACEILFVDLLFDELISHLGEEEVLGWRMITSVDSLSQA